MGLGPTPCVAALLARLQAFMEKHVLAADAVLEAHARSSQRWSIHPLMEQLKVRSKKTRRNLLLVCFETLSWV